MKAWLASLLAFLAVGSALTFGCAPSRSSALPAPHPMFGAEAKSLLAAPVTIEVRPSAGRTPYHPALALLAQRLQERSGHAPTLVIDNASPMHLPMWNRGALDAYERTYKSTIGPRVIFVAWLGGMSSLGPAVAGETFSPHSFAIYADAHAAQGEILVHELGHVLGLVRTPRMDRVNPFHDVDPRCVMFWRTTGATDFCGACKGDLEATKSF